jgi:hypothetical protein
MYRWLKFARAAVLPEVIIMSTTISSLPRSLHPNTPGRRRLSSASLLLALLILLNLACARETPPPSLQPPPPDVVSRVTAAKTIFLSNAGANDSFGYEITGGANVSYNELYAALQQWGYFQLVDSPAHADLIFQIHGTEFIPNLENAFSGHVIARQHAPNLELTILDPHPDPATLTPLDTITVPAGRGEDIPKGTIAFAQSIEVLTYQIGTLVAVPRPTSSKLISGNAFRPSFESLIKSIGPIPPQLLSASNVFVENDASPNSPNYKGFIAALTTWGHYHLADSAQSADVVFHFNDDQANGASISITDPTTKAILWTITDPHFGFYHQSGEHRVTALNQNLISLLKQLNGIQLTPTETAALH